MRDNCLSCGELFDSLGTHWRYNPEHKPELSEKQKEIANGLLMGDASVVKTNGSSDCCMTMENVNEDFLLHLCDTFGSLCSNVSLSRTGEQQAERVSRFTTEESEFQDVYSIHFRNHEYFSDLREWYSSGEKVFPEIELTSTILKYWYCCDGYYDDSDGKNRIVLSLSNEIGNEEKIGTILNSAGITEYHWRVQEREDRSVSASVVLTNEQSLSTFEYMGSPPPGFDYKWPQGNNSI
jgi:hypothetical protein